VWPLPAYDARCLLIGLEVLSDRRIVASALFARDILVGRVDCPDLALMLRFEEVPYSRRRNAGLMTFFHRTHYGGFEPVNYAIINFNKYCHWFGFCSEVSHNMFWDRLKSALSGEPFFEKFTLRSDLTERSCERKTILFNELWEAEGVLSPHRSARNFVCRFKYIKPLI
jgi:hypothetical protein